MQPRMLESLLSAPEAEAGSLNLVDDMQYEVIGPCWVPEQMWGHAIKDFEEKGAYLFRLALV
jgi:hypothetical protein